MIYKETHNTALFFNLLAAGTGWQSCHFDAEKHIYYINSLQDNHENWYPVLSSWGFIDGLAVSCSTVPIIILSIVWKTLSHSPEPNFLSFLSAFCSSQLKIKTATIHKIQSHDLRSKQPWTHAEVCSCSSVHSFFFKEENSIKSI